MITLEAFYKVTYGLYLVSSGNKDQGNGFISNTVFQVTSDPPTFAAACNKNNFTASLIQQCGYFAFSVLHTGVAADIIGRFGFKSGRDFQKLDGMQIHFGTTGVPIVLNGSAAFFELKLTQTIDAGTHLLFIGELVHSEVTNGDQEPLTYAEYRKTRKGISPKNAPTYIDPSRYVNKPGVVTKKFKCSACGYIYDEFQEKVLFKDLPEDWVCPVCGSPKEDFIELTS